MLCEVSSTGRAEKGKHLVVRRDLLVLVGALAAVGAGWQWYLDRPRPIEFEPLPGLAGWRQATVDGITVPGGSATSAVFAGIGESAQQPLSQIDLCNQLYPSFDGKVSAAVFSDANCPNCRRLEAKLHARSDVLNLKTFDLPLLGPSSVEAAKAFVSAELQSSTSSFRASVSQLPSGRLIRPIFLRAAQEAGLDSAQFEADLDGSRVAQRLKLNSQMADTLGVWGTPALTIGKTLVMGDIRAERLDALIAEEATRASTC